MTVTLESSTEEEVRMTLFCSMSMRVALPGPIEPVVVVAEAPVKTTEPKSAKPTSEPPSSKSSTIHSVFCSQSALVEVICWVTVTPVVLFSMTAEPEVVEDAVTVTVTVSLEEKLMPEKS